MNPVLTALKRPQPAPRSVSTRLDMAGSSLQSRALATYLQFTVRPFLSVWAKAPNLPWPMSVVDYAGMLMPPLKGTDTRSVMLAECEAEWIRAEGVGNERVVLYLHGGAFVCCGLNTHRRLTSRVSQSVDAPVLSVDYRMMPRNPISQAVEDGVDGYRFLLDSGYRPDQIFIAGDSAGGYLSFMVALTLRDLGLPTPAGIFTMSPLTDMDPTGKIEHANASKCAVFPSGAVPALTVLADRVEARIVVDGHRGPRVSPVDADLTGLPPVLIQAGSTEIVLADAELMIERLEAAGVHCELQVWEDQVHVFQAADFVPESHRALREIGAFVRSHSALPNVTGTA
ncbi:alpha/beta hydrolase [Rhodococcoides yunnanense]|jgi:acetyl esterase/lipase|uniref:alpha/beta hydrolase n=1 Tax=Rhodococcoides yunnanense TaxID=278209 RepID=UPI0022B16C64|nr:alpha/beta hydrolase [Rhodococcus yunnanensis]MCZ4277276.1 alpha/beta hydrolase [Rhodococcus yunnanensis]